MNGNEVLQIYYAYIFPHIQYGIKVHGSAPMKGISVIIANDIINMHYYFLKHKISTCCSQN